MKFKTICLLLTRAHKTWQMLLLKRYRFRSWIQQVAPLGWEPLQHPAKWKRLKLTKTVIKPIRTRTYIFLLLTRADGWLTLSRHLLNKSFKIFVRSRSLILLHLQKDFGYTHVPVTPIDRSIPSCHPWSRAMWDSPSHQNRCRACDAGCSPLYR